MYLFIHSFFYCYIYLFTDMLSDRQILFSDVTCMKGCVFVYVHVHYLNLVDGQSAVQLHVPGNYSL